MPNTSKNFWNRTIDLYAFTIVSKLKASLLSLLRTSSHKCNFGTRSELLPVPISSTSKVARCSFE